jgi:hypothetical protein
MLLEEADDVLEELPGRVGVVLDEASKLPHGRDQGLEIGLRRDRGRANAVADERDLAEMVSGAEDVQVASVGGDAGRALRDDEEPDASLGALLDDNGACREGTLRERARELLELFPIEAREQRDTAQCLHGVDRHGAIVRC